MKQEIIHIDLMDDLLKGPSISNHEKPAKLMIMLHGYGDNASNFIHMAELIDQDDWGMHYLALNAPNTIPGSMMGYQWFDLYPGGVYISNAGPQEYQLVNKEIEHAVSRLERTINFYLDKFNLTINDCFIMGFSQGGIVTFELARRANKIFAGIAILSGRIIEKEEKLNLYLKNTPIFISHGSHDDIIPSSKFDDATQYLKNNKYKFESHLIEGDTHTISPKTINLFQKFIKKII